MPTLFTPRRLAVAQLLRLPNVFTAVADAALACAATGLLTASPVAALLVAATSATLYLGGMVWNDVFDRAEDARARPFRPLPSGRITVRGAVLWGTALFAVGLTCAAAVTFVHAPPGRPVPPLAVAALLSGLIVLYDAWLKHTPAGPWAMGGCRALNVLFGLSVAGTLSPEVTMHLAGTVGVYIAGVTLFARTEETDSRRGGLIGGAAVMAVAAVAAALLPAHDPATLGFRPYPYLVAGWILYVGTPVAAALGRPDPKRVQHAVKRGIFGLVLLDAALATAFVGPPGLLIVLLLVLAVWLGRRVYST